MNVRDVSLARVLGATLLGAAVLTSTTAGHAAGQPETLGPNLVVNGGFERGADPGPQMYITPGSPYLENWGIIGSQLRVVGTYWQAEEGMRSLSLANANGDASKAMITASGVKQTVSTTVGQRYRVSFYQAGNPGTGRPPGTVRCLIGGQTHDYTYQATAADTLMKMNWVQRSFIFIANAARTDIAFYGYYTPGNMPFGIDNVQVRAIQTSTSQATPVPAGTATQQTTVKTTLLLTAASLAPGAKQTVTVSTGKNSSVALIVDYPDRSQFVVQGRAD
ncbi:MAG: hypothetical protein JWO42_1741, partial [Chloroflexi bacterium]|nr:hypothetical protein [Chloroflexota bacterium]